MTCRAPIISNLPPWEEPLSWQWTNRWEDQDNLQAKITSPWLKFQAPARRGLWWATRCVINPSKSRIPNRGYRDSSGRWRINCLTLLPPWWRAWHQQVFQAPRLTLASLSRRTFNNKLNASRVNLKWLPPKEFLPYRSLQPCPKDCLPTRWDRALVVRRNLNH